VEDELGEGCSQLTSPAYKLRRWGNGNAFSHLRTALMKPSITIPLAKGRLSLGTWQQILFIVFNNQRRDRKFIVQVIGE